jgi:hypothetical protein
MNVEAMGVVEPVLALQGLIALMVNVYLDVFQIAQPELVEVMDVEDNVQAVLQAKIV